MQWITSVLVLFITACGGILGSDGGVDGGSIGSGDSSLDGSNGERRDGGSMVDGHVASSGACPCSTGYYCDLSSDTCVAGCISNGDCGDGHICQDCSCIVGCANCADDGNACTTESCDNGTCRHTPVADGTSCGDYSRCVSATCKPELAFCAHPSGATTWSYFDNSNSTPDTTVYTTCTCDGNMDLVTDGTVKKSCTYCHAAGAVQCY